MYRDTVSSCKADVSQFIASVVELDCEYDETSTKAGNVFEAERDLFV